MRVAPKERKHVCLLALLCFLRSEIGNFCRPSHGKCTTEQINAERTHWGLWCIVSSPLILGFDMNDTTTMDRIWPTITNTEALVSDWNTDRLAAYNNF